MIAGVPRCGAAAPCSILSKLKTEFKAHTWGGLTKKVISKRQSWPVLIINRLFHSGASLHEAEMLRERRAARCGAALGH